MLGDGHSPPNLQADAGSFCISFVLLPPLQSPTFTVNPPRDYFLPDKPHRQITDIKDAGQIWKWFCKPQNEWREEITFQLPSNPLAGQQKQASSRKVPKLPKMGALGNRGNCSKKPREEGSAGVVYMGAAIYWYCCIRWEPEGLQPPSAQPASWDTKWDRWGSKTQIQET